MVGHLTLLFLCPQVVERHHSLISFASWERSAPQISCKWVHSSLVEACSLVVRRWNAPRYVRLLHGPEPRQSCLSSGLAGSRSGPFNPRFSSGSRLAVCVGFQMDGAGNASFHLGSWGICGCDPGVTERVACGSFNKVLVAGVRANPSWTWEACNLSWWCIYTVLCFGNRFKIVAFYAIKRSMKCLSSQFTASYFIIKHLKRLLLCRTFTLNERWPLGSS